MKRMKPSRFFTLGLNRTVGGSEGRKFTSVVSCRSVCTSGRAGKCLLYRESER